MRILFWTLSFLATIAAAPAWSNEDGWKLEKDRDGIQIYTRAVEGWSIREIRGVTRVSAPLPSVVAVLNDVQAIRELTDVVAQASVPQRDSETRYQIYSMMKMPWPVNDRDILNQRVISQDDKTLVVTFTDTAIKDGEPKKDLVRIVNSRQQWTLTPTADGGVTAEMRLLSDPAGPIPSSVINAMSVSTPFKTLTKLKELAQRPQYAKARPAFIKAPSGS